MDKLERINKNISEMRAAVAALNIEAKAAKAALAVSAEALETLRTKIEHEESLLRGIRNEIEEAEAALRKGEEERDKLKSHT